MANEMSEHVRRIEREAGLEGIVERLADTIEPADLHTLLLEVYRRRASRRAVHAVRADYDANRFVAPSPIDPRSYLEWDRAAFGALPEAFVPIELSPLAPFGACSIVAGMSQDKSVVTARNLEVLSDSTNVLALECARRRRALLRRDQRSGDAVHLAASHRLVRPQAPVAPGFAPHFRLFGMCSAGRNVGEGRFHADALVAHVATLVRAIATFLGTSSGLRLVLTDLGEETPRPMWHDAVVEPLRSVAGDLEVTFDQSRAIGRTYYTDICYHLYHGATELADGGAVDWGARILSNARERMVICGLGSDRVVRLKYPADASADDGPAPRGSYVSR
jgi:hypothetical protein